MPTPGKLMSGIQGAWIDAQMKKEETAQPQAPPAPANDPPPFTGFLLEDVVRGTWSWSHPFFRVKEGIAIEVSHVGGTSPESRLEHPTVCVVNMLDLMRAEIPIRWSDANRDIAQRAYTATGKRCFVSGGYIYPSPQRPQLTHSAHSGRWFLYFPELRYQDLRIQVQETSVPTGSPSGVSIVATDLIPDENVMILVRDVGILPRRLPFSQTVPAYNGYVNTAGEIGTYAQLGSIFQANYLPDIGYGLCSVESRFYFFFDESTAGTRPLNEKYYWI